MPTANLTRDRPSDMQPQSTAADNVHPLERVTATTSDREIEHPSLAGENARDRATTISDSEAEADTTEEVFKEHFDVEDGSQISCGEEPGPDEDEERADMGHGSQSTNTTTHPLSTTTAQQAAMRCQRRMEIIRGRRNAREAGARGRERAGTPVARLPTQGSQSARQPTLQQGVKTDMGQANDAAEATDVNHGRQTGLGGLGNADAERVDSDTMEEGAAIIVRTGQDGPRNKRRKKITVFIKQWARCYAPTCRFGIYSSQMVESINNAIKKIRILPVGFLLCVGIGLLALSLTPADAMYATSADLNREGTCYRGQFDYGESSDFDYGMVAQVPSGDFNSGKGCGRCYEVSCMDHPSCLEGSVLVRAVGQNGDFNLNFAAWDRIVADRAAGRVEIDYRSVDCPSNGGMKVRLVDDSNSYNFALQILGAAWSGGVENVELSNDGSQWSSMTTYRWGATWVLNPAKDVVDAGRPVSVRVTGGGQQVVLQDVIPSGWSAGTTYESGTNF
ncbi:unnamed protein product [Closterium sp. NIES-65]|nr:unnamed protein product [Closterium sp. NIES-65]CAI6011494.1 unnamed protein product [Closterium sp. NIES-65]